MIKTLDFPLEVKNVRDDGHFEGYASIFGNVDQGMDVVEAGAFKEIQRTKDGKVLVLNHHAMREPIGKADVQEDEKGLYAKGKLVLDDPTARRIHTHMKAGTIDALSIGYDVLPGGAEFTQGGVRVLKALKLWEISVVTWGMNELARIDAVKAAGQLTSIREYEDFLRDVGGFSKAQAKQLASGGWMAMQGRRDAGGTIDITQLLTDAKSIQIPSFSLKD